STLGISPGGLWEMPDYYYITKGTSIDKYGPGTNPNPQAKSRQVTIWCDDLPPWVYPTAKVTEVEAAVVVYPRPPVRDTVTCEPQSGPDSTHPSTYFYDVTPGEFGRCDFHVRVYDSIESNYSNWVQPNGWQHALHKVGSAWWVSWYNPPCDNAIFSKFRFQFDNDNEAVWGDWTTTIDGSIDPYAQLIDSAGNHSSESNGYGYRVHVPKMTPLVDSAISLDTVIGSYDGDLVAGEDLKFVMRLTYNPGSNLNGINNGFRVYSPDGATWQPIVGDTINLGWSGIFDLGPFINYNSANGSGADTVGFNAAAILQGMTAPFDNQVWWIQTKVSDADSGKHLCVDSSFYNPGGNWVWAVQSGTFIFPSWDGPHCFQITGSQTQPDGGDLAYCGYVGGSSGDLGHAVAVDAEGCAYITGGTLSSSSQGFPVKVGPDPTYNYYGDVFVAKVSPEGDSLIYCGYIGGEWSDAGCGIAVDAEGCAYVTGYTESQYGFPTIVGPDYGLSGTRDAFAAKLNASGTSLVYCGYIGGWGEGLGEVGYDEGRAIAVDVEGCAYISGFTNSDQNYWSQLAVGPDLTYNGGEYDAFVTKVAADGSGLIFCGYVGGSGDDYGYGIAVDDGQYPYVTGYTNSTESTFPTHIGPDLTHNGTNDAFVTKVDYMGTGFVYSGFIGGSNQDYGHGITVDLQGAAYVAGDAFSTEVSFPVEVGPDLTQNGSNDAFIAKVMVNGTGLTYCGYIGGEDFESGYGVAIDATGNAYVTGKTWSTQASFPVIQGPDLTFNGASDGYVAKVNAAGTALDYCGYIGGAADEQGNGVAVDQIGNAYIAGSINSDEASFPVEIGPDLTHNGGGSDAFVAKVSVSVSCCMPPLRGNIDYDPGDLIDISDLVYLVDYMFTGGPAPHCMEEADINGDGQHDIADLVFLVDYMFSGGPDPAGCGKSGSLCAPSEADPGVTLLFDYADGYTTISLDADIAIRGLQLELVGDGDGVVRKLGGDQIDMVSGSDGRVVKIGILDLDGPMTLEAGSCEIASLKGRYTVTEALAVDKSIRKVLPTVLASANGPSLPSHFVLHQNYPNPFNPTTEIGFALPRACHVSLNIYNVLGQRVTTLLNERLEAGHHFQEWHANGAASGVYFYRIRAEDFVQTKKMMLLK
ncbi:MAG: SBBP repeat-containing protein, partial [candidate division Zixibacteria bacterium]|nr:SBBP repeat-containing protein [candidate division Zixibacteria bacterium]